MLRGLHHGLERCLSNLPKDCAAAAVVWAPLQLANFALVARCAVPTCAPMYAYSMRNQYSESMRGRHIYTEHISSERMTGIWHGINDLCLPPTPFLKISLFIHCCGLLRNSITLHVLYADADTGERPLSPARAFYGRPSSVHPAVPSPLHQPRATRSSIICSAMENRRTGTIDCFSEELVSSTGRTTSQSQRCCPQDMDTKTKHGQDCSPGPHSRFDPA